MPVTSNVELIRRRLTTQSIQRQYHLFGNATEAEVLAYIGNLPQTVAGMALTQIEAEENTQIVGEWLLNANYGAIPPGSPLTPQTLGTVEYEFNFVAPSGRIKRSLQTISATPRAGQVAPNWDGLIGVVDGPDGLQVEGIDVSPPPETFSLRYAAPNGIVTSAYQSIVENMVGKVNSFTFASRFPAGSLFLTRVNGRVTTRISQTQSQNSWNLEFGFAYSANAANIPVGSITVPSKLGWHLLWTFDTPEQDAGARFNVLQPHTAYVERIYDTADFRQLGLPGYTL